MAQKACNVCRMMAYCRHMNRFSGKTLKGLVKEKGYRINWLADQVGVSAHTMSAYLCGSRVPSRSVVKLLAQVLGTKEETFFDKGEAS